MQTVTIHTAAPQRPVTLNPAPASKASPSQADEALLPDLPSLHATVVAAATPQASAEVRDEARFIIDVLIQTACGKDAAAKQAQDALLKIHADPACELIRHQVCNSALAMCKIALARDKQGNPSGHSLSVPVACLARLAPEPPLGVNGHGPQSQLEDYLGNELPPGTSLDPHAPISTDCFTAACARFTELSIAPAPLTISGSSDTTSATVGALADQAIKSGKPVVVRVQADAASPAVTAVAVASSKGGVEWHVINPQLGNPQTDAAAQWAGQQLQIPEALANGVHFHYTQDGGDAFTFALLQTLDDNLTAIGNGEIAETPPTVGEMIEGQTVVWAAMEKQNRTAILEAAHTAVLGAAGDIPMQAAHAARAAPVEAVVALPFKDSARAPDLGRAASAPSRVGQLQSGFKMLDFRIEGGKLASVGHDVVQRSDEARGMNDPDTRWDQQLKLAHRLDRMGTGMHEGARVFTSSIVRVTDQLISVRHSPLRASGHPAGHPLTDVKAAMMIFGEEIGPSQFTTRMKSLLDECYKTARAVDFRNAASVELAKGRIKGLMGELEDLQKAHVKNLDAAIAQLTKVKAGPGRIERISRAARGLPDFTVTQKTVDEAAKLRTALMAYRAELGSTAPGAYIPVVMAFAGNAKAEPKSALELFAGLREAS